ncbi:MAG TPA: hypothetical protein VIE68_11215 [Gemmatimonadota bacterium]
MRFRTRSRLLLAPAALAFACGGDAADAGGSRPTSTADSGMAVVAGPPATGSVDVTVAGRVLDDSTGEALVGGYVIVLAPGVSFDQWERSAADEVKDLMAGAAVTDSLGRFEVPDLPRGSDFTVVVAARGHAPAVFESGLTVMPDDPPITRLADVRLEPR